MVGKYRDTEQLHFLILTFLERNQNKMIPKTRIIGMLGLTIASARNQISSLAEMGLIKYDYVGENERYYPFKVLSITEKGRKFLKLYKELWVLMPDSFKTEYDIRFESTQFDSLPETMFLK